MLRTQICKRNLHLAENRFGRKEIWRAVVYHNNMLHIIYAERLLDSNFDLAVKMSFFHEIARNFTFSQKL